ncbi:conserved hypothetical protein [delta proteobacterium NaphS2]|nr:conserved hypothetical protein [delta proteobacterium NaphS2]
MTLQERDHGNGKGFTRFLFPFPERTEICFKSKFIVRMIETYQGKLT